MFRLTSRDLIWLIIAVVVGAALFGTRSERQNAKRAATRQASDEELAVINRYKAAKTEFEVHAGRRSGSGVWPSADEYCAAIERFAQAAEARDDLEASGFETETHSDRKH